MTNLNTIKREVTTRSKAVLETVADIVESVTRQNLAVASEVAGFAVGQIRMPVEVKNLSDFRERQQSAYSKLGGSLADHGQAYISTLKEIPQQLRESWTVEMKPVKKTAAKPAAPRAAAAKKRPVRKAAVRKAAVRKAPAKRAAKK